jgi:dCTP deaminase
VYLPDYIIDKMGPKLIAPFEPELVNPASYDITLDDVGLFKGTSVKLPYTLQPGDFILVSSRQYWKFPCDVAGQLLLKSTLGRNAINHMLAGWFDPDFHGNATMELKNEGHEPFTLEPGARVAQMVFYSGLPCARPYRFKGRYHGQRAVTGARQAGASKTLDKSPMWVAGPFGDVPFSAYTQWYDHIVEAVAKRPELGTVEKLTRGLSAMPSPSEPLYS